MHSPSATAQSAEEDRTGLGYQRCRWCGTPAYRRLLCPTCASPDLAPARSDGVGIVTRPPHSAQPSALVQLREGFTVQGRVVGALRGGVHPGSAVRLASCHAAASDSAADSAAGPAAGEMEFQLCEVQPGFAAAR